MNMLKSAQPIRNSSIILGVAMTDQPQGCTKRRYEITHKDLPLCCPMPQDRLWDAHPRVYFPIEKTGQFECPYCGAEYILTDYVADVQG